MNRAEFLAIPDVSNFIDWLVENLPRLDIHLSFAPSRFVPGGLDQRVRGVQNVLRHYRWANSWFDYQSGVAIRSDDWTSTTASLLLLRDRLQSALNAEQCNVTTLRACEAVLTWGGVRGALPFLRSMCRREQLVAYLQSCQSLFSLKGNQTLANLNSNTILRYDAGLTKIHALADNSGLPIYDSRVGAAIALLYALYRRKASVTPELNFASGSSRGQQVRDPGALGFARAPQFYTTSVSAERWAQCQLELGWILRETIIRSPHLVEEASVERQCHALEASLFMIGYDLRCMNPPAQIRTASYLPTPVQPTVPPEQQTQATHAQHSTWVPTVVPFVKLLQEYLNCCETAGRTIELSEFRKYQLEIKKHKKSTARNYCYPFRETELDLPQCSLEEIKLIALGGAEGLNALGVIPFVAGDEREQVYFVTAFLAGRSTQIAANHGVQAKNLLVHAGFARTINGAEKILSTGKEIGQHFGLLSGWWPTIEFHNFFGDALEDLEYQLQRAAAVADQGN